MKSHAPSTTRGDGPGVPEALPRAIRTLVERLGADVVDRLWLFPPLVRGRREWGLVAASRREPPPAESDDGEERRTLFTAPYEAERTGKGLHLEVTVREQGTAPPDRLPRVMDGVVRRSGDDLGEPREVEIECDPARFDALMEEFDTDLFQEPAQPLPTSEP